MNTNVATVFLQSAIKRVAAYRDLGNRAMAQLDEEDFYIAPNEQSNSIAVIIQHLSANMISRWTNFLTEDGEKPGRTRDVEFIDQRYSRSELQKLWNDGWDCFLDALNSLKEEDLLKTIYIRSEPLIVLDAINRQVTHYPNHVGQIIYIARMLRGDTWKSLTIPPGGSAAFNASMNHR